MHEFEYVAPTSLADAVAGRGGVLVGRNATIILAHEPGALHVKIDGPVEQRLERAAAESGIDLDQARKRQRREDRVRVEISKRLFRWDPSDDAAYDLVAELVRQLAEITPAGR